MAFQSFDPPGLEDDLNDAQRQQWSDWVSSVLDEVQSSDELEYANDGPRPQFFNPLKTPPGDDAVEQDISWTAFPRILQITSTSDTQRWRRADATRDNQDEYCEWSVTKKNGKIVRVEFTSEGPEYWTFLAAVNPAKVLELYQQHVNPAAQMADLFQNGTYNPRNVWNNSTTNGAMHLIQRNNTLAAEMELAAAATLPRLRGDGSLMTDEQELIACGRYGAPQRHSDPHIGAVVNDLARRGAQITLANPVGLCIAGLSVAGWETPDGSDPAAYWKITRGTPEKALRAVYEVPDDKGFNVGDIKIADEEIRFGAQIADRIQIKLTGLATRFGETEVTGIGCVRQIATPFAGAENFAAMMAAQTKARSRR